MGERSYSIYLLHPFIIFQLRPVYHSIYQALDRPGIAFLICAGITLLAAGVTRVRV